MTRGGYGRTDPDEQGGELDTLGQFLDYHRATLQMKCDALTAEQLATPAVAPANLTLLGLVRHLSEVERYWCAEVLDGQDVAPLYCSEEDPDGDLDRLDSAPVEQVWSRYRADVAESRRILATFSDGAEPARRTSGSRPRVRWVLTHLIEEYARHNGHADLLRQALDGGTGE